EGDQVVLAIYNRRPYLLWGVFSIAPPPTAKSADARAQIRLRWTSLHGGKWKKAQQSTFTLPQNKYTSQRSDGLITDTTNPDVQAHALERFTLRFLVDSVSNDLVVTLSDAKPTSGNLIGPGHLAETFRISGAQGNA